MKCELVGGTDDASRDGAVNKSIFSEPSERVTHHKIPNPSIGVARAADAVFENRTEFTWYRQNLLLSSMLVVFI